VVLKADVSGLQLPIAAVKDFDAIQTGREAIAADFHFVLTVPRSFTKRAARMPDHQSVYKSLPP
jgi:hypothetical protein